MKMLLFVRYLVLTGLCAGVSLRVAGESATNRFAFTGPEIFPLDPAISLLHAADLDGDGWQDLVVVNNARSKINLLYNQTGRSNLVAEVRRGKRELNELPPDSRFLVNSIAAEKRISALVVADLNGDGKPDLAYYGEPKELLVIYNEGPDKWSAPKRWPIEDGLLNANALAAGDLNGDGRTDLILLAENHSYLLAQAADHTLGEPEKLPLASAARALQVLDLDNDGRNDLLLVNFDNPVPFRVRLQQPDHQLGPELFFKQPPIHSYWGDNLEGGKESFLVSIAANTGRAVVAQLKAQPAETLAGEFKQGQLQVWPLSKTDKARRGLQWADVNGDGRTDLLVAEPERGQLAVYLQKPDGTLAAPRVFPTLAGVSDIAVSDWNGDGKPEIFLLSADERQVGVTRFDEKERVAFPELIPLEGKPLALAVGGLQPKAKPTLAILTLGNDERRALVTRTADGKTRTQQLDEKFKSNPTTLLLHDVDQDGRPDLVALVPYEKVKVLLQVPGKDFAEIDVAAPGGAVEQPWLSVADVDGDGKPELLLTQKNFLRAVVLQQEASPATTGDKTNWVFRVKEQINGAASNSRLTGAVAVPRGTNATPSLFLLDAERKALTLCERDAAGVWQVVRNVPVPLAEFSGLQAVAWGGGAPNSVAFLGVNTLAWLPLTGSVWEFVTLDSYETPIKDGNLNDVTSGDLNHDGRKELVFMETSKNYLDLVVFDQNHKLVPAERWQVFEQKTFRGRGADAPEPREAVVADLTGDGKNDLAIIVHDRVLLYPQE